MTNAVRSHLITSYDTPKKEASERSWTDILGSFLITTVLILALGAWNAFVLWKFYDWFVVPLGTPPLNWWHIWGLLIFFRLATNKLTPEPVAGTSAMQRSIGYSFGFLLALPVGWLISGMI